MTKQERAHPRTAARPRERVSPIDDGDVVGGGRIVLALVRARRRAARRDLPHINVKSQPPS